jgi:outer membrane protein
MYAESNSSIAIGSGSVEYDKPYAIVGESGTEIEFLYEKTEDSYFWMEFEHQYKLPNIRFESASMAYSGVASTSGFIFGKFIGLNTPSTLDLTHRDIIAYADMNILPVMTLDYGAGLKNIEGQLVLDNITEELIEENVPYLYVKARVELEYFMGVGIESSLKYISFDGSTLREQVIKADITYGMNIHKYTLNVGFETGVRSLLIDVQDSSSSDYSKFSFEGVFMGLYVTFE